MHRLKVAGDIYLRKPRPTQGCRADDDDDDNSPPSWGLDVPLAMAICKTFLLRMLNDS
jgi:hypothetical protein